MGTLVCARVVPLICVVMVLALEMRAARRGVVRAAVVLGILSAVVMDGSVRFVAGRATALRAARGRGLC